MANDIRIDKDIPLWPKHWPNQKDSARSRIANALRTMKVGDSTVDLIKERSDQTTLLMAARKNGLKVATRKLEAGGWRCWRVA
jgi:hypothetical protein